MKKRLFAIMLALALVLAAVPALAEESTEQPTTCSDHSKITFGKKIDDEYHEVLCGISDSIEAVYTYRNSILGILESISADYSQLNFDAEEIQKKLGDPNNMAFFFFFLTKLG